MTADNAAFVEIVNRANRSLISPLEDGADTKFDYKYTSDDLLNLAATEVHLGNLAKASFSPFAENALTGQQSADNENDVMAGAAESGLLDKPRTEAQMLKHGKGKPANVERVMELFNQLSPSEKKEVISSYFSGIQPPEPERDYRQNRRKREELPNTQASAYTESNRIKKSLKVRMYPALLDQVKVAATKSGISQNQWIELAAARSLEID